MIKHIKITLTVLALVAGVNSGNAQNAGAQVGNGVKITLRGVPVDDATQVSGLYTVTDGGAIRLPYLERRLSVLGLKADQISVAVENAYKAARIYQSPSVEAVLVERPEIPPDDAKVSIGGQVTKPGPVPFRQGMTLIEAIQAAGDRGPFGAPRVELIRKGKVTQLTLRNPEHKITTLQSGDVITVQPLKPLESR